MQDTLAQNTGFNFSTSEINDDQGYGKDFAEKNIRHM